MATKIITAWVNGQVQEIEVEVTSSEEQITVEDRLNEITDEQVVIDGRLDELEDKPIITDGNMLVGNGTEDLVEMTPEDVLSHINGASVLPLTTAEYEAIGENSNANTLYVITDDNDSYYTDIEVDEKIEDATKTVKDDLLNGAGEAYDTLKELGELIDENHDAIDALEIVATNKADKDHTHDYLPLTGGTVTGDITAPNFKTSNNGFQYNSNGLKFEDNSNGYKNLKLNMSGLEVTDGDSDWSNNQPKAYSYHLSENGVRGRYEDTGGTVKEYSLNSSMLHMLENNKEITITPTSVSGGDEARTSWQSWLGVPLIPSLTDIKPNFADNSWETIAQVAKYGDPSRYWKVGDYKMLNYPAVDRIQWDNVSEINNTYDLYLQDVGQGRDFTSKLGTVKLTNKTQFAALLRSKGKINNNYNTCKFRIFGYDWRQPSYGYGFRLCYMDANNQKFQEIIHTATSLENLFKDIGVTFTPNPAAADYLTPEYLSKNSVHCSNGWTLGALKTYPAKQYPIMICGFGHDNASNPNEYGKQKAGITFCLGVSRACFEQNEAPPYNWEDALYPNLYESGTSEFESGTTDDHLRGVYFNNPNVTNNNWEICGDRIALQQLFVNTEISDYIVPVEKRTACGTYNPDLNYYPSVFTNDKVFFPSEYEINGMQKYSPAIEGEQYEFFKRGYSRFFWNSRMKDATAEDYTKAIALWSRSMVAEGVFTETGNEKPNQISASCLTRCTITRHDAEGNLSPQVGYGADAAKSDTSYYYGMMLPMFCF